MNFNKVLEQKKVEIEQMIAGYLPEEKGFAAGMAQAMNYSMEAGERDFVPC